MKYHFNKNHIIVVYCALAISACTNAPKQSNSAQNGSDTEGVYQGDSNATVTPKTDEIVQNVTVVPKQQVGLITSNMTEVDIKKAYGETNVARVDRGDVKTAIFPNSDKELEISWKKGHDYKKLETAIIRKGDWKTAEGIGIGTTVEELNKINGKQIELFQREENYAMVRWKDGKVDPKLKAIVDTDTRKVIEIQIDF